MSTKSPAVEEAITPDEATTAALRSRIEAGRMPGPGQHHLRPGDHAVTGAGRNT